MFITIIIYYCNTSTKNIITAKNIVIIIVIIEFIYFFKTEIISEINEITNIFIFIKSLIFVIKISLILIVTIIIISAIISIITIISVYPILIKIINLGFFKIFVNIITRLTTKKTKIIINIILVFCGNKIIKKDIIHLIQNNDNIIKIHYI